MDKKRTRRTYLLILIFYFLKRFFNRIQIPNKERIAKAAIGNTFVARPELTSEELTKTKVFHAFNKSFIARSTAF